MSKEDEIKSIKYIAIHQHKSWREKSFSDINEAIFDDKRGAKALFADQHEYINKQEYGKPLFALIWDTKSENDAIVIRDSSLESATIPLSLVKVFKKSKSADLDALEAAFESKNERQKCLDIIDCLSHEQLEQQQLINARLGQGKFRRNVKSVWGSEVCALTLMSVREMLVVPHIKTWSDCTENSERLDGANGILLCAHIGKLFENHLITFRKYGSEYRLKLSQKLDKSVMRQWGIDEGDPLATGYMGLEHIQRFDFYLSHHQAMFDKKNDDKEKV
ncbi:MAG: HNH endonuclease [Parashewanella sp.]